MDTGPLLKPIRSSAQRRATGSPTNSKAALMMVIIGRKSTTLCSVANWCTKTSLINDMLKATIMHGAEPWFQSGLFFHVHPLPIA